MLLYSKYLKMFLCYTFAMIRTLSKNEAKIILEMELQKTKYITIKEVMTLFNCSYSNAKNIIHRLVKKNWLEAVSKGKYFLISADSGTEGIPTTNSFLIGSLLIDPYYFSYGTANSFYGFTTQVPSTVYIATIKSRRNFTIRNTFYHFVTLSSYKFFGYDKINVFDVDVFIAEKEKAIIDSIDKMKYSGGVFEVVDIVKNAISEINIDKMLDYAVSMKSSSLLQRLGFLLEYLKIPFDEKRLLSHIGKTVTYLDPLGEKKGKYNARWSLIQNFPKENRYA